MSWIACRKTKMHFRWSALHAVMMWRCQSLGRWVARSSVVRDCADSELVAMKVRSFKWRHHFDRDQSVRLKTVMKITTRTYDVARLRVVGTRATATALEKLANSVSCFYRTIHTRNTGIVIRIATRRATFQKKDPFLGGFREWSFMVPLKLLHGTLKNRGNTSLGDEVVAYRRNITYNIRLNSNNLSHATLTYWRACDWRNLDDW